jgi:hypothetical protein
MRLGNPDLKIGIFPRIAFKEHHAFLSILGEAIGLNFEAREVGDFAGLTGILVFSDSECDVDACRSSGLSLLQFHIAGLQRPVETKTITFANSDALHPSFRGQTLDDPSLTGFHRLDRDADILARIDGLPVWARERSRERSLHTVGIDLPGCAPDGFFQQFFRGRAWFAVLPLLAFLRDCIPTDSWAKAEARASFIIDDPNLHATSYGFVDFRNLARHAEQHNYHASIATIPLDMWYTNATAAATFRDNRTRLSLLLHGVTHVSNELAQECTTEDALAILADGLKRAERFERKSGLTVARVIAAPHGAFSEHFASAMELLEFEGACVSVGSLLRWNPQRRWPADTGWSLAQAMGDGALPVFHRIGPSDIEIRLLLFLGQPVIVTAHHQDCAMNYRQFENVAATVNAISKTRWCSVGEIARSNYYSQVAGSALEIFLFSRKVSLELPPGTSSLKFKPTPVCATDISIPLKLFEGPNKQVVIENLALNWDGATNQVSVRVTPLRTVAFREQKRRPIPWWPLLRRFLTESRDRSLPLVPVRIQTK